MRVEPALRESVVALARQAGDAILEVYGSDFAVRHKHDDSPVTAADLAAHHCIADGLRALTPDIPVLSEESAHLIGLQQRRAWSHLWLVDPLDGTRDFVKRNGEFSVNIALIVDGVAEFGVIQQPVGGALWWAQSSDGAFRRDGDAERRLQVRLPATGTLQVAASRSHRDPRTDALLQRLADVNAVAQGSSLKFCRIAEGDIDLYPRYGPTSEWDTAAGQVIVEQAGGVVLDLQGRPLRYNRRDTLLNGEFVAAGDPALLTLVQDTP